MVVVKGVSIGHGSMYVAYVSGLLHGREPSLTRHSMKTKAAAFQPKTAKYDVNSGVVE